MSLSVDSRLRPAEDSTVFCNSSTGGVLLPVFSDEAMHTNKHNDVHIKQPTASDSLTGVSTDQSA